MRVIRVLLLQGQREWVERALEESWLKEGRPIAVGDHLFEELKRITDPTEIDRFLSSMNCGERPEPIPEPKKPKIIAKAETEFIPAKKDDN